MRVSLCVLILAAWATAEDAQDRLRSSVSLLAPNMDDTERPPLKFGRSKLPFIADAVGNTLPPPSNVPATVGSPVNLLTPDRYEFYTFDESGELVKRLMTLEEIQAIVAAGEETESLVTFANDNQPTIAFNFSQPPYTKVHSVVSNVQNVLKAQMEAHRNKPQTQPPLDTPDVSDSWSLILPSIFGNTGVDIVPDKTSGSFITPETDTFELDTSNFEDGNFLSKEGTNIIPTSSTTVSEKIDKTPVSENILETTKVSSTRTTTGRPTTTPIVSITTSTIKTTTVAKRRVPTTATTTTTTSKPKTTSTTSIKTSAASTTTVRNKPLVTTNRPFRTTTTQHRRTTVMPTSLISSSEKPSSTVLTTRRPITTKSTITDDSSEIPNIISSSFGAVLDSRKPPQHEKINTINPTSTVAYVTERTTRKPLLTTKVTPIVSTTNKRTTSFSSTTSQPKVQFSTIKPYSSTKSYLNSINSEEEYDKSNTTTITTQSVSPSTTVSSTELININNQQSYQNATEFMENNKEPVQSENLTNNDRDNEPMLPLFDVAQSISQIASDLGGSYAPLPTSTNLLDNSKPNKMEVESKENIEIDIPTDVETEQKNTSNQNSSDNFIKISTLDPNEKVDKITNTKEIIQNTDSKTQLMKKEDISTSTTTSSIVSSTSTTIDPYLSESMEDLLSQVVHSAPESIINDNISGLLKPEASVGVPDSSVNKNNLNVVSTPGTTYRIESSTSETETLLSTVNEKKDNNVSLNNTNENSLSEKDNTIQRINSEQNESEDKKSEITDIKLKNQTKVLDIPNNSNIFGTTQIKPEVSFEKITTTSLPDVLADKRISDTDLTSTKNYKVESITSTESLPLLELTTTIGSTTRQQAINVPFIAEKNQFLLSSDKNSLTNKNQKVKEPLIYPKIDEFKKKIQKVNIDDKELANERNNSWKLISTVSPPKGNEISKDRHKIDGLNASEMNEDKNIILDFSKENQGLEVTTKDLGEDIAQFTELCNELAFQYWIDIVKDIDKKRSFILSPYSITSMLAMMFMGARGSTSGEMNDILKLDDMVTFNPHFTLKNISDSIETSSGSGVAISAFIRELYSDRSKGKILTFYKERAQQFYNGHVEEINFKLISDIVRRRTNLLVKRYTWGKIIEYMKTNNIVMNPPLAAFSANIFQTDCSSSSVEGRDGEMYFVVSPNVRQRRLVPVPAVVYRSNFLAGYDPVLDATAAALGNTNSVISTLFLMPGQQGNVVHAEDLEALEKRLLDSNPATPTWNRLLRTLLPRVGLELQIPRFSHKSTFNVSSTLRRMGLKDLFDHDHADLGGLNGPSKDLFLSDMIQTTTFVTCGEGIIAEQHHIEEYPETLESSQRRRTARWVTGWDEPRDYQRAFHDPHDVGDAMHLPLHLRPRQARLPSRNAQPARLKFDRPFLFFVRHNPSGMILYVGRYNPRLLP